MDWNAHNAGFVLASYLLSGLCLAGLAALVLLRDRQSSKQVEKKKS
ncbi:MAG: heme exporter protein CcmD [Alphaproteobacteria bacterium]|nr:heme exporter protein CcmD [Alphaproteobacteria bacterium]